MKETNIDITHIPFSRYGAYVAVTRDEGKNGGGREDLARTVAERYCAMSALKAKGNYENFDALTGLGRRAPGYTWAASVYMLLHREYGC